MHKSKSTKKEIIAKKPQLNKCIAEMILTWFNILDLGEKLTNISDLKDGVIFTQVVKLLIQDHHEHFDHSILSLDPTSDVNSRFQLIDIVLKDECNITSGVNFDAAKTGCEWELAKIGFVLLMNGINKEISEISTASDKLDGYFYEIITNFYSLMEKDNLSINKLNIKFYENYLALTENKRRSLAKESAPSTPRSTAKSSHTINCTLSPLQKISIHSPKVHDKVRRRIDDDFALEKKKLEKELRLRDMAIFELEDQLKDKIEELKKCNEKKEELFQKVLELKQNKEKIDEYENLQEKLDKAEKDVQFLENKCNNLMLELKEMKYLRELKQNYENQIKTLTSELSKMESKEAQNNVELKRLKSSEYELESSIEANKKKDAKIHELILANSALNESCDKLNKEFNKKKFEFKEVLENLNGEKASLQIQVNSLNAQYENFKQEATFRCEEQLKKITQLEENLNTERSNSDRFKFESKISQAKLEESLSSLFEEKKQIESERNRLSTELTSVKLELESVNKRYNNLSNEMRARTEECNSLQSTVNELNFKYKTGIEQLKTEVASLNTQVSSAHAQIQQLNSELEQSRTELSAKAQKLDELSNELQTKCQDFKQLEQYLNAVQKDREDESRQNELELEASNEARVQLEKSLDVLRRQLSDAEQSAHALAAHSAKLESELADVKSSSEKEKESILTELSTVYSEYQAKIDEVIKLQSQLAEQSNQLDELRHEFSSKQEQAERMLNEMQQSHSSERAKLSCDITSLKSALDLTRDELDTEKHKSEQLTQQVSGLNNELKESREVGVKQAAENQQLSSHLAEMCGKFKDAEKTLEAVEVDRTKLRSTLETTQVALDAERTEKTKWIQKSDALANELKEIRELLAQSRMQNEALSASLEHAQLAHNEVQDMHRSERTRFETELAALGSTLKLTRDELGVEKRKNEELEATNSSLTHELRGKSELAESWKEKNEMLSGRVAEMTVTIEQTERMLNEMQLEKAQLESELSALRVELDSAREQIESEKSTSVEWSLKCDELCAQLREQSESLEKQKSDSEELRARLAQMQQALEQAEKMLNEIQVTHSDEKAQLGGELNAVKSALEQRFAELEAVRRNCDEWTQKSGALTAELKERSELVERLTSENEKLSASLAQVGASLEQANKRCEELSQSVNAAHLELKNKQAEIDEKNSTLMQIQNMAKNFEQDYMSTKHALAVNIESLDNSIKERKMLADLLTEKEKKLIDMEISFNKQVIAHSNEIKSEYQAAANRLKDHIHQQQENFNQINKENEAERAKLEASQRRLREELVSKQNELDLMQKKMKLWEEKERGYVSMIEMEKEKVKSMNEHFENEKQNALKLSGELENRKKVLEEQAAQLKNVRDWGSKLEEHYKQRKKTFEESEIMNKDLKNKLESNEKELSELTTKVIQNETRNRSLVDEINFLKNKINTIIFENQQLRSQKDELVKKLSGLALPDHASSIDSSSSVKFKHNVLSTPKGKFLDDSYVKYTSPELRTTGNMFDNFNQDELASRRFSIDSFSRNANNNTTMMPTFNRFNTISEHEFEEPDINRKSFHIENPSTSQHRLSTLQIRNQQVKPHLKSSYALELMLSDATEDNIRGRDNKENRSVPTSGVSASATLPTTTGRASNINVQKRRNDDPVEQNSPKKSHMAGIKQTHI